MTTSPASTTSSRVYPYEAIFGRVRKAPGVGRPYCGGYEVAAQARNFQVTLVYIPSGGLQKPMVFYSLGRKCSGHRQKGVTRDSISPTCTAVGRVDSDEVVLCHAGADFRGFRVTYRH